MLNKLLYCLTARLPCRLIELDSGPYLERYYVGQLFGVTFYLHRFVSSDSERHVHNHPWNWGRSVILLGSYVEERVIDLCPTVSGSGCVTEHIVRRWYNKVDGNTFHRIHHAKPGTWTLFFHGRRARVKGTPKGWGFLKSSGGHTIFTPFMSAHTLWWLNAPVGHDVGREPFSTVKREW